jgi:Ig-like domain from next to BRCA1 gene
MVRVRTSAFLACLLASLFVPFGRAEAVDCVRFGADLTVPDGTVAAPGQAFDKAWRLYNCGETAWEDYTAELVDGEFGPATLHVPKTGAGLPVHLWMHGTAPEEPGCHRSYYQLHGREGAFGGAFFVEVLVVEPESLSAEHVMSLDEFFRLPLPAADIGGDWSVVDEIAIPRERCEGPALITYYQKSDPATPQDAQPYSASTAIQLMPNAAAAEAEVVRQTQLPTDAGGPEPITGLGDGAGAKIVVAGDQFGPPSVTYLLRINSTVVAAHLNRPGPLDQLDSEARGIALAQAARVRAAYQAVVPAFSSLSVEQVPADPTWIALDELPAGFSRLEQRTAFDRFGTITVYRSSFVSGSLREDVPSVLETIVGIPDGGTPAEYVADEYRAVLASIESQVLSAPAASRKLPVDGPLLGEDTEWQAFENLGDGRLMYVGGFRAGDGFAVIRVIGLEPSEPPAHVVILADLLASRLAAVLGEHRSN